MTRFKKVSNIFTKIIDIIYPKKCVVCKQIFDYGESNKGICDKCIKIFEKPKGNVCEICGRETENRRCSVCSKVLSGKLYGDKKIYFTKNYPLFLYNDATKIIIFDLKYNKKLYTISGFESIIKDGLKEIDLSCIDIVMPIPMYKKKEKIRGFNQAKIFAKIVCEMTGLEYNDKELLRIKNTTAQNNKSLRGRYENIEGCFKVLDSNKIKGKTILLIDDIYTSGSTINISSKELINNGAKEVYSLTLSITSEKNDEKF